MLKIFSLFNSKPQSHKTTKMNEAAILISTEPGLKEYVAGSKPMNPQANDFDAEAAADFSVPPANAAPVQPKAETPKAAPAVAPVQPNFSSVASLTAPDPMEGARAAERQGQTASVWQRLKVDREIYAGIAEAKKLEAEYVALRDDIIAKGLAGNASQLIERLDQELGASDVRDVATLVKHSDKVHALKAITPAMVGSARRMVALKVEAIRAVIEPVLDKVDAKLAEYHSEAIEAERAFLASHGLPHTKTAVSHRVEAAQAHIPHLREGLKDNPRIHPNAQPIWNFYLASILGPMAS